MRPNHDTKPIYLTLSLLVKYSLSLASEAYLID